MKSKTFKHRYGDWAIVTGASSGIGKALAHEIASQGINIVLIARREDILESAAAELKSLHQIEARIISADISEDQGIDRVIQSTQDLQVGLLVLSAGMENNGLFIKNHLETELKLLQLNVVSTMKLTHHFTQGMVNRNKGGLMFVSSMTAHMPSPYFSNYSASKSYVLQLGKSIYGELKPLGVDVSILSPGITETPMATGTGIDWTQTPIKPMSPETVAKEAMKYFGRKQVIIPGKSNRMMAFVAKYIIPEHKFALKNGDMMRKVIGAEKL